MMLKSFFVNALVAVTPSILALSLGSFATRDLDFNNLELRDVLKNELALVLTEYRKQLLGDLHSLATHDSFDSYIGARGIDSLDEDIFGDIYQRADSPPAYPQGLPKTLPVADPTGRLDANKLWVSLGTLLTALKGKNIPQVERFYHDSRRNVVALAGYLEKIEEGPTKDTYKAIQARFSQQEMIGRLVVASKLRSDEAAQDGHLGQIGALNRKLPRLSSAILPFPTTVTQIITLINQFSQEWGSVNQPKYPTGRNEADRKVALRELATTVKNTL